MARCILYVMQITPAILAENYEQVVHQLFLLEGVCERVQIDLCDGVFGLEKTWLPYREDSLPHGFRYEFDLMVNDWRKYLPRVIALGATRIIVHIDTFSDDDIYEMIELIKPHFIYLGLCVSNDKNVPSFVSRVHFVEAHYTKLFIQVMGIKNIGAQGQPFDETVLKRISYIRDECRNIEIQVDGAMRPETLSKVKNAGARGAVIGSYLFKHGVTEKDLRKNYETLKNNFA